MIQFDDHIFQVGWFNHQPDSGLGIIVICPDLGGLNGCFCFFEEMDSQGSRFVEFPAIFIDSIA